MTGCSRVSEGCRHCYIERTPPFRMSGRKLGDPVQLHPDRLDAPLYWKKPRRVFVNSISDLFHDDIPEDFIKEVFTVMAIAKQHTFQILTKRPERMRVVLSKWTAEDMYDYWYTPIEIQDWPLPNVWLGVSVEDQQTADERIPILLQTPAAVPWVSAEPLLGPVDLSNDLRPPTSLPGRHVQLGSGQWIVDADHANLMWRGLDWVVVGGESGPTARPCDVAWIRSIVGQCQAAAVPCFVKQLGSQPRGSCDWKNHAKDPPQWLDEDGTLLSVSGAKSGDLCHAQDDFWWPCQPKMNDKKGGTPDEWPADLRVREWPR